MEKMQVLNDGADEEDFKDLLQILNGKDSNRAK